MADYTGTEAYDFSLFETDGIDAGAARTLPEEEQPIHEEPAKPEKSPKAKPAHKAAHRVLRPAIKSFIAIVMSAVIVAAVGFLLNKRAQIDTNADKIAELNKAIGLERSDNGRLNKAVNSMFTKKEVEEYAEKVLGMVKLDNYNTYQLTLPKNDEVIVAGGEKINGPVCTTRPIIKEAETKAASAESAVPASAAPTALPTQPPTTIDSRADG